MSASLIACAVQGSANIRLLNILDGFFTDSWSLQRDLPALLTWGSSSGSGALAGMLIIMRTF